MENKSFNLFNQKKELVVAGKKLDPKNYPVLYRWAERNPETLTERLQDLADKVYSGDIVSAAQMLESDLEHSQ